MQRGAMSSLARARPMRFQWEKLVTPLTPKAVVADWRAKAADIDVRTSKARSVKKTVEPIDWAAWEAKIQAPGVVAEMKKEYEALSFPKVNAYDEATLATVKGIEADIVTAKKQSTHAVNEVKEADKTIAQVKKLKAEGLGWSSEQWYAFMPGLEEQHKAEYEDEDYLVSDDLAKLETVDYKAAAKELVETGDTDLGTACSKVGDASLQEELDLVKGGTWSIARVFASKDERAKIQDRVEKQLSAV